MKIKHTQIARKRQHYLSEIRSFLICAAAVIGILFILFRFIFGIYVVSDDSMEPVLSAGDIILYQRAFCEAKGGDIVIYESDDDAYIGRIAAVNGDTVNITEEDGLYINGNQIIENNIYFRTSPAEEGMDYPLELKDNEIFILCDHRTAGKDSRSFGPVMAEDIKGVLFLAVRISL